MFSDYSGLGRKLYCYPQTPLTWVTLGLWALVVPLNYPCWGQSLTREEGLGLVRSAARAAEADVVLLTGLSADDKFFYGAAGFLLRSTEMPKEARKSEL